MNIRSDKQQQLVELAEHLETVAAMEQPSAVDWKEAKQALEDDVTFLRTYIIPRITIEPRYSSTRIAELVVPERDRDMEIKPDDSSASFLPTRNGS